MKLLVINGPNLNMLGIREPEIYGKTTYNELCKELNDYAVDKDVKLEIYQSNHEGDLIDKIQQAYFDNVDGIIINAGAYTHTSIAIADAIRSVNIKCVEVHISDINNREDFRKVDYIECLCVKKITGHGIKGYFEAIDYLTK